MLVSIITASFNSARTIEATLRSVTTQTYQPIEYIIVDGGSTDTTLSIAEQYRKSIAKIISEPDNGIFDAMNKGIKLATGDIIGILNSDDVYASSEVINQIVQAMEQSQAEVCWGNLLYVDKYNTAKVTRTWKSSSYQTGMFKRGWQLPHPTFFVRRSVYQRYGLFRTDLPISADYELGLRFLEKHQVRSTYLPLTLVRMQEGGNSNWKNLSTVLAGNQEVRQAWRMNNLALPWYTIPLKLLRKIGQLF